jgi:serine protease Do/serine protease DegQ
MKHRTVRLMSLIGMTASLLMAFGLAVAQLPAKVGDAPLPSLAPIIKRTSPAVVGISVKGTQQQQNNPLLQDPFFRRFFDVPEQQQERQFQASGSGVIVDAQQGYIITNAHVVENAKEITVTLLDNRELKATVKGSDANSDIAVVQVKAGNLTAITLADSSKVQVGDFAIAIGNPFGLEHTVTSGIISALGRAPGINRDGYEDLIQTDASINPGNSGGALLDLNGQLIGINSAIYSSSGGNIGIGFAIPSNMAKAVMDQLIKYGKVQRGVLGVSMQTLGSELADSIGAEGVEGALVSEVVEGSAAEKAGIKPGDVITSINGKATRTGAALRAAIGVLRVGDKVEVGLMRDGKPRKVTATIAESSDSGTASTKGSGGANGLHQGLSGAEFASNNGDGVLITAVAENSNAAQNGLRRNDVIIAVGRAPVNSVKELREAVKGANSFLLTIQRGNRTLVAVIR